MPNDVAMMAEAEGGMAAGRRVRRRLRPRRRAVDRAAMRPDWDYFRQLAFGRKVAGDVPAICGVETKVCRPLPRIEHDSPPLEFVAHEIKWRDEVRIA